MQGPFSTELNLAIMRQFSIKVMVTKDGGKTGGFAEKMEAAAIAGVIAVVIGRPPEPDGLTMDAILSEVLQ
jgi:precorrin-6x reductase